MKNREQRPSPPPIELRFFATDGVPPLGSKFVAFYGDGSGASIMKCLGNGSFYLAGEDVDSNMKQEDFLDAGFHSWALLPDDFEIWGEGEC